MIPDTSHDALPDPADEPAPMDDAGDAAAGSARVRWIAAGRVEEIELAPAGGPQLVPCVEAASGAELATLLVEALDRAAIGAERIRVSRGGQELFLDRPAAWPRPRRSPSEALAGDDSAEPRRRPGEGQAESLRRAETARRVKELSANDRAVLSGYRAARRDLAARQRNVERRLLGQEREDRLHARVARLWGLESLAALGAVLAGAVTGPGWLLPVGAAGFCIGAAGLAVERLARPRAAERRRELDGRLAECSRRTTALERQVRAVARTLGVDDPWEAADAIALGREADSLAAGERDALVEQAKELAEFVDLDPAALDSAEADSLDWAGDGWPAEVSARTGARESGDATDLTTRVIALARLVTRIRRDLPEPWPVVLWEPWPDLEPDEQARLLLALSRSVAPRSVLAFVSSR